MTFRTLLFLLKVAPRQRISGILKHITPFPFPLRLGFAVIPRNTYFLETGGSVAERLDTRPDPPMVEFVLGSLAPVVQTLDSAIHGIKICPVHTAICFSNTYPRDSDLSGG